MAERTSSAACKKFLANVFHENKCQNCFKPKDAHQSLHQETTPSVSTAINRPTTASVPMNAASRQKTTVKSGNLNIATQISTLPEVRVQKWEKAWMVLDSAGILEWFSASNGIIGNKPGQTSLGSINLDDCIGLTSAEVDINEQFTIGVKTPLKQHYLKAENRLEMDNWCRVLKPFVIASPSYNFNGKTAASRTLSIQDVRSTSGLNKGQKSIASRTVSAPWQSSVGKSEDNTAEAGLKRRTIKPVSEERPTTLPISETVPEPQPYYGDKYLSPDPPVEAGERMNGEVPPPTPQNENDETPHNEKSDELKLLLADANKQARLNEGKAEVCSKNLTETKKCLQKANNTISIQKANIESLKSEMELLQVQLKNENTEKQVKELENGLSLAGGVGWLGVPESVEAGFLKLQGKLRENEEALIRRTRELERANENRAKVAKHTRSLLLELESKLNSNNRRISELEEQLMDRTLDLQYEKEERERIEREKGTLIQSMGSSKEHMKQREITKKSTELLEQAKQDHIQLKNVQKSQARHLDEIELLRDELRDKNVEVQRLRKKLDENKARNVSSTSSQQLDEALLRKAQEESQKLQTELRSVNESLARKGSECVQLRTSLDKMKAQCDELENDLSKMKAVKYSLEAKVDSERQKHDEQIVILEEDNAKSRGKLQEVNEELRILRSETDATDGAEIASLKENLKEWEKRFREIREENEKLEHSHNEVFTALNNEKDVRLQLEEDLGRSKVDGKRMDELESEVSVMKSELVKAEKLIEVEQSRVYELEDVLEKVRNESENAKNESAENMISFEKRMEEFESEKKDFGRKLCESDKKILSLAEELERRLAMEQDAFDWIEGVENRLSETDKNLIASKGSVLSKLPQLDKEKTSILDAVKALGSCVSSLENALKDEKSKVSALEVTLQATDKHSCELCEQKDSDRIDLAEKLQRSTEKLAELQETSAAEVQSSKTYCEEIRLKLTSKVILLQSDITELRAKSDEDISKLNVELSEVQKDYEELQTQSSQSISLSERITELEAQLENERILHSEKLESLRKDTCIEPTTATSTSSSPGQQNGEHVTSEVLQQLEERYTQEINELKALHEKELEDNKSDMMMVLQALKSDSYQSNSMSNESLDCNEQMCNKHERYVETLKKDHEVEIGQLKEEHEQDLQQLRSDMVTLLRVQESYKTKGDEQPTSDNYALNDLNRQLENMRQHYEREAQEREERHKLEVEQLKGDMLVAIQAASVASGGSLSSDIITSLGKKTGSNDSSLVLELQEKIANMESEFDDERDALQNTIKKAESATKFGLRRNEEMSNKIYQMQREMEEIDAKYQKEIKMYKEAYDEGKSSRKQSMGTLARIQAESESSLRMELQEMQLSMEQIEVRHDAEIKRYKDKFQQENVLTVEELQLKIKSLEDTIEQMRLEHAGELDRYTKAVKRGKVSLAGTVKERDLERKIDDLESKVDVMRQKHREEVRKYRERLEDEMERHRKEVTESRAKLRKLELDCRHAEELRNKIAELENKAAKHVKETGRYKDMEFEVTELRGKNRELQRGSDSMKRKLEKFEEAAKEEGSGTTTSAAAAGESRSRLSRYPSMDSVTVATTGSGPRKGQLTTQRSVTSEDDTFEMNNNTPTTTATAVGKTEIGGYKLNPGLKRPASISSLPTQAENTVPMRRTYSEKRRETSSSNRPYTTTYGKSASSAKLR